MSEEHITAFGWASPQDLDDMVNLTIRINDFLTGLFLGVGIKLVDFKVEFGRLWENDYMRIVLADEISPDTCRLWDVTQREAGQGPFPPRYGRCCRGLFRSRKTFGNHARIGARRSQGTDPGEVTCVSKSSPRKRGSMKRGMSEANMKARVFITLKNGVLDPQGKAIGHALNGLGLDRSARCARAR